MKDISFTILGVSLVFLFHILNLYPGEICNKILLFIKFSLEEKLRLNFCSFDGENHQTEEDSKDA